VAYYAQTTFRVSVGSPSGVRYQWRFGDLNIPGGTNATLVLTNVQPSQAGSYHVVVYNGAGAVISSSATLTVLVPVSIIAQPVSLFMRGSNDVVNYGQTFSNAVFTVQASSGNPPVTYQWYRNGAIMPGRTSATLTITNATMADEGLYHVNVSDAISTAPSDPARLTVGIVPFVTQQIQGRTVAEGSPVTLQLGARGNPTPFGYRFRRTGVNVTNIVTSQTTAAVTLPSVRTNEAGTYTVIVTNAASFQPGVLSSNAYLTVVVPPTNQVADSGANVAFSVAAFGTGTNTYQWRFNGSDLPGATSSTLVVSNAQASGIYSVVVNVAANPGTPPIAPATFSAQLTVNGQVALASPQRLTDGSFRGVLQGAVSNEMYVIEVSTNLINWATSSTIRYTNSSTPFTDSAATNSPKRFYRARLP
jgi:hypothetical protein